MPHTFTGTTLKSVKKTFSGKKVRAHIGITDTKGKVHKGAHKMKTSKRHRSK